MPDRPRKPSEKIYPSDWVPIDFEHIPDGVKEYILNSVLNKGRAGMAALKYLEQWKATKPYAPPGRWYKTLGGLGSASAVGDGSLWKNVLAGGMGRSGEVNLDDYVGYRPAPKRSWLLTPKPKQAGITPYNAAELATLTDIDSRARHMPAFREWLSDLLEGDEDQTVEEVLANDDDRQSYLTDWLHELGLRIEEHGCIAFWRLDSQAEELIGDLPVIVYHHTSTRFLKKIKKEGLRADVKRVNTHENSGAGVYVTTEVSGPVVNGYHYHATKRGGNPVTLTVRTYLGDLEPDPDDADISSGATQFILPYVAPQDIFFD